MAKKKNKLAKSGAVWHLSAEEATLRQMPRYNGFATGHGVHGDTTYNRRKEKRDFERRIRNDY